MTGYIYDEERLFRDAEARAPHDYLDALKSTAECWRRHRRATVRDEARARYFGKDWQALIQPGEIVPIPAMPPARLAWVPLAIGAAFSVGLIGGGLIAGLLS